MRVPGHKAGAAEAVAAALEGDGVAAEHVQADGARQLLLPGGGRTRTQRKADGAVTDKLHPPELGDSCCW